MSVYSETKVSGKRLSFTYTKSLQEETDLVALTKQGYLEAYSTEEIFYIIETLKNHTQSFKFDTSHIFLFALATSAHRIVNSVRYFYFHTSVDELSTYQ